MGICTCCGEVIEEDNDLSDDLCDQCRAIMNFREDVPFDENDDEILTDEE